LSATRRGIFLLNSVRRQIHQLAARHELLKAHFRSEDCAQCDEQATKEEDKYNDEQLARQLESMSDLELENPLKYNP